jgi:hypothetical protein
MAVGLARRIAKLITWEAVHYVAFLFNVPIALSLLLMVGMIAVVLEAVYGVAAFDRMTRLLFIGKNRSEGTLQLGEILRLYAWVSLALFLCGEVTRAALRLKPMSLQRHLLTLFIIVTLGWGLILVHAPFFGASSRDFAQAVVIFYLLGVGGCGIGAVVAHVARALVDRLSPRPEGGAGT